MKLVDYGSESDSEESDQQEPDIKALGSNTTPPESKIKSKVDSGLNQQSKQEDQEEASEGQGKKKKVMLKYSDLPKFLKPTIHKEEEGKGDGWKPKTLAEIEMERKKRVKDLSDSNDQKANRLTKIMRLPSPKHAIQNEAVSGYDFKKVQTGHTLPPSLNPDKLFSEVAEGDIIEEFDKDDIYISKKHQLVAESGNKQQELRYANRRDATEQEQDLIQNSTQENNIRIQEVTREQLIGDSNWQQNHQKAQQKSILREGLTLSSQVDKSQKQKNQLNYLAAEAIAQSDYLDQQRAEQIKNSQRKRERYGW